MFDPHVAYNQTEALVDAEKYDEARQAFMKFAELSPADLRGQIFADFICANPCPSVSIRINPCPYF